MTRRRASVAVLTLLLSVALVGSLVAPANAKAKKPKVIDSAETTTPRPGPGTVTKNGKVYEIVLPLFVINQLHHFVLKSKGTEVDSFELTVTPTQGQEFMITTAKGGRAGCTQNHDFDARKSEVDCDYEPPEVVKAAGKTKK